MEKRPHRGTENLLKKEDRTPEERRKSAQNAGVASGIVRRHTMNARATMKMILNLALTQKEKTFMNEIGGNPEIIDNKRALMLYSVTQQVTAKGDPNGMVKVLEVAGEHTEALDLNTQGISEGRPIIQIVQAGPVNQLVILPQRINGSPLGSDEE